MSAPETPAASMRQRTVTSSQELDRIVETAVGPAVAHEVTRLREQYGDEAALAMYHARIKLERQIKAAYDEGYAEGRAKGLIESITDRIGHNRVTWVRNGLAAGIDPQTLAAIFAISVDDVHRLSPTADPD